MNEEEPTQELNEESSLSSEDEVSRAPEQEELPEDHRSGFVAVVGRPNVGKSTLMNAYLGEKVAIVSAKPQTTRIRQLGILTLPHAQLIFVDTPGIHEPRNKLGEYMVEVASRSIPDADAILFVVDVSRKPNAADVSIAEKIKQIAGTTTIIAMNKSDTLPPQHVIPHTDAYCALLPDADWMLVSATRGDNRDELLQMIVDALPFGPRYYPPDQLTDAQLRENVAEIIREKALEALHQEVPHSVAVQVEEFKERGPNLTYVSATIYVEKESQKGIVIGDGGKMLRAIGSMARKDLQGILGTKVFLELWVKVLKNWRKKDNALRRLGYVVPKKDRNRR
jgi:GTP-binding protein Era